MTLTPKQKKTIKIASIVGGSIVALLVVAILLFVIIGLINNKVMFEREQEIEATIIELANDELNDDSSATLVYIKKEVNGYAKYEYYTYVLIKEDGTEYMVGVLRNDKEVFYVDVIEEV